MGPCRLTRAANAASPVASPAVGKSLEELPVGQPGDGAAVEQRLNLPDDRW